MVILETILAILDARMEIPTLYGWFHILALVLTVAACVLLCRRYQGCSPDKIIKMVRIVTLVVIGFEIYKQINFTFGGADGIRCDYMWYAFPFQFCSTPMYIGLLAGFTRKGRIHEAACAYLASFSVFAGLSVMVYPASVFVDVIGINIQTMFCHGSMIVVGAFLLATGYVKADFSSLRKAMPVFLVCVCIAAVMNEVAYRTGLLETETFDMFFISPYGEPSLPVYSLVQAVVPFPLSLVIYVAGFSIAAYLVLLAAKGIMTLAMPKAKNAA